MPTAARAIWAENNANVSRAVPANQTESEVRELSGEESGISSRASF